MMMSKAVDLDGEVSVVSMDDKGHIHIWDITGISNQDCITPETVHISFSLCIDEDIEPNGRSYSQHQSKEKEQI